MVRTQIQLTEAQARELRRISETKGVSIASLIRELVDTSLMAPREARFARAMAAAGRFSSGKGNNVSEEHDAELERIYMT